MKTLLSLFVFGGLLASFVSIPGYGQEIVDVNLESTSDKRGSAGQKDAFDKAIEKISLQYIEQIIGEAKTNKNFTLIKNRIIKNSGKYVLFIRGQNPKVAGDGMKVDVSMRVSIKNLEKLLLEEGLLYKFDGPPKVLPFVSFVDRVNSRSFSWWNQSASDDKAFLVDQTSRFHRNLRKELRGRGFFGLDPVMGDYKTLLPAALLAENPSTEDALLLSDYLKAQIITRGQVIFSPQRTRSEVFRIDVRLAALHAVNGRVIGEVVRTYETEPGPFNQVVKAKLEEVNEKMAADLAIQIFDAWKSGTFGATLLTVGLTGSLSYKELQEMKALLVRQVKDIKTIKERLFEPGRVVYEVDASTNAEALAQTIAGKNFSNFKVSVAGVRPSGVDLRVSSR